MVDQQPDDDSDTNNRINQLTTHARDWAAGLRQRVSGSDADKQAASAAAGGWQTTKRVFGQRRVQLALAAIGGVGVGVAMAVIAAMFYGALSGVAVAVGLIVGLAGPWTYVRVFRTPFFGGLLATAFFILAQLTFGAGAIVRREDGRYEWRRLQQDDNGQLFAELSTDTRVDIDGDEAELPTLAWAPVAVVGERTDRALSHILVDKDEFAEERPDPKRGVSETVATPLGGDETVADGGEVAGKRIDASKLERWCRGSADSEPVRAGLRKALEEEGGSQQLSELYLMIGAGVLLIFGFGMTAAVMLL